jgi:hypothetical protein
MSTARTHDAIGRRHREQPYACGKRIAPTERDVLWFDKLHRHGPLSTPYLLAYSRLVRRSDTRARDRLTDLFNEDETPHGGTYLSRPWQQFETLDARYHDLVYDLTPRSVELLKLIFRRNASDIAERIAMESVAYENSQGAMPGYMGGTKGRRASPRGRRGSAAGGHPDVATRGCLAPRCGSGAGTAARGRSRHSPRSPPRDWCPWCQRRR